MVGTELADVQALVDRYIARFEALAADLGPITRFYAFQADELQALQWDIQERDPDEQELHDRLIALYGAWLDAMSPAERDQLFAYNRAQEGERWSPLLAEELEPRYAARER